jgi:serine/threonine protein kinase
LKKIDYDNPWIYKDEPFTSDDIGEYVGFVYLITDQRNGKKYIGKKTLVSKRKLPPLKGKTRRRTVTKESDWKTYYGSSEEVQTLVEEGTPFKREILHLAKTKGVLSYLEAKEQFDRNVLLTDDYYNGIIQCKIHKSHVKDLLNDDEDS